jgi:GNAT superfamily N-acetyltransferase
MDGTVGRRLPGTGFRVRRGRRGDLPAVQALLAGGADEPSARIYRRAVADLGVDVYVAEDASGAIVGLVSLTYARSLARGGRSAVLDGIRTRGERPGPVIADLVGFAEERARRRGCRRLAAWVEPGEPELRAALLARGYRLGELFAIDLGART